MKRIPSHVLRDAVVIVPPLWDFTSAVPYLILLILFIVFTAGFIIMLSHLSIPWPFYLILVGPMIVLILAVGWEGGLWRDVILGRDTVKGQVVLAERQLGEPRRVVRIVLAKVQAVRISWRAMNSSDRVWWIAQLALSDGKIVPLHSIEGKQDMPPESWLARFTQVSVLLGKPLEICPLPTDSRQVTREQAVDWLIKNIRN